MTISVVLNSMTENKCYIDCSDKAHILGSTISVKLAQIVLKLLYSKLGFRQSQQPKKLKNSSKLENFLISFDDYFLSFPFIKQRKIESNFIHK